MLSFGRMNHFHNAININTSVTGCKHRGLSHLKTHNLLKIELSHHCDSKFDNINFFIPLTLTTVRIMADLAGAETDAVASYCDHGCQTKTADAKFYNIDDPPSLEDQLELWRNQPHGPVRLMYIRMKMKGLAEYTPLVYCINCAAEKYVQYCNNDGWVYDYMPCAIHKDL